MLETKAGLANRVQRDPEEDKEIRYGNTDR